MGDWVGGVDDGVSVHQRRVSLSYHAHTAAPCQRGSPFSAALRGVKMVPKPVLDCLCMGSGQPTITAHLELHEQQIAGLGQAAEEGKDVAIQVEGEVTHACNNAAHDDHQDGCGDLVCGGSLPDDGLRKCDGWGCVRGGGEW